MGQGFRPLIAQALGELPYRGENSLHRSCLLASQRPAVCGQSTKSHREWEPEIKVTADSTVVTWQVSDVADSQGSPGALFVPAKLMCSGSSQQPSPQQGVWLVLPDTCWQCTAQRHKHPHPSLHWPEDSWPWPLLPGMGLFYHKGQKEMIVAVICVPYQETGEGY